MNSTQLIEYFKQYKEDLGEKATDFNMFLEGYALGISDVDVKKQMVDIAGEEFEHFLDYLHESGRINLEERESEEWLDEFKLSVERKYLTQLWEKTIFQWSRCDCL